MNEFWWTLAALWVVLSPLFAIGMGRWLERQQRKWLWPEIEEGA